MAIKKHDFVELEYVGKLKDSGDVFDTTDEKVAKKADIFNEKAEYKPIVICIGEKHIIQGIDDFLEGKELGEYKLEVKPEQAFGKKDAKLMRLIPISKFKEQNIQPIPGLRLNIDGYVGTVRNVSGGRTIVDFNHPLAGRELVYEIKANKIITDKKIQIESLLKVLLGLKGEVEVKDNKAVIKMDGDLPKELTEEFSKKIKKLTNIDVVFENKLKKEEKKEEKPKEEKAVKEATEPKKEAQETKVSEPKREKKEEKPKKEVEKPENAQKSEISGTPEKGEPKKEVEKENKEKEAEKEKK